jgi:hypothetical protein
MTLMSNGISRTRRPRAAGPILWDQLLSQTPPAFQTRHIPEPSLSFRGGALCVDPKTGIELFGPAALDHSARGSIRVGLIGTGDTISQLKSWVDLAKGRIDAGLNSRGKPYDSFLAPSFPGFCHDSPFGCELSFTDRLTVTLTQNQIDRCLTAGTFESRVRGVVELVSSQLSVLADKNPPPDVVICAMPKAVEEACGRQANPMSKPPRIPKIVQKWQKRIENDKKRGQLSLFESWPDDELSPEVTTGFRSFHNALKAHAMRAKLTTQLVWESTLESSRRIQDPASVAWNFFTALYFKADNMPWEMQFSSHRTCFLGISFYRESSDPRSATRTALAQAFSESGEGLVLRGESITWDRDRDRQPHLNRQSSERLLLEALDLYSKHFNGPPNRVVLHKTSRYWPEELEGFRAGLGSIHSYDFLALERRGIQFLRLGYEPPIRGTMVELGRRNYLVYTQGYIPFLRCYPGPRIPNPLEVVEHHGDSAADVVCSEILSLTKLNWNSCAFASGDPVTIKFAKGIGSIMKELPTGIDPLPRYKFYM